MVIGLKYIIILPSKHIEVFDFPISRTCSYIILLHHLSYDLPIHDLKHRVYNCNIGVNWIRKTIVTTIKGINICILTFLSILKVYFQFSPQCV